MCSGKMSKPRDLFPQSGQLTKDAASINTSEYRSDTERANRLTRAADSADARNFYCLIDCYFKICVRPSSNL